VEFDLAQVKRTKEAIALNIRIKQRAQVNKAGNKNHSAENGERNTKSETREQHVNGDSAQVLKGWIASLKDTFGFIETITHDKEIFFHYRCVFIFLLFCNLC